MKTPPIVSPEAWEAARLEMLVKEKAFTRARDRLAAERRRMPWMPVEKAYQFEGPKGTASLLDLFEDRCQLIVYRAFFEPGVAGWPDYACRGCSFWADQVAHVAHLNARDTTLVSASRASQADIARLKAKMGWDMPGTLSRTASTSILGWTSGTATTCSSATATGSIAPTSSTAAATRRWGRPGATSTSPLGRQEVWEDSPEGYPQTLPYKWWNWHDNYDAEASPDPKWVEVSDAGAALRKRDAEANA
jgi:predicted dithiol-disulfide oxidoreductase (DUF899 family)